MTRPLLLALALVVAGCSEPGPSIGERFADRCAERCQNYDGWESTRGAFSDAASCRCIGAERERVRFLSSGCRVEKNGECPVGCLCRCLDDVNGSDCFIERCSGTPQEPRP